MKIFLVLLMAGLVMSSGWATLAGGEAGPKAIQELIREAMPDDLDPKILLVVQVDKTNVYPGEQIFLKYYLLTTYDSRYEGFEKEVHFRGFWLEEYRAYEPFRDADLEREIIRYKLRRYVKATLRRMAFFPLSPGEKIIDPGSVKVSVKKDRSGNVTENMILSSKPIHVVTRDFPREGKPDDFSGLSGEFTMNVSVGPAPEKLSGEIILVLKISGKGNIRNIKLPTLPLGSTLKLLQVEEKVDISWMDESFSGSKTFLIHLDPQRAGAIIISPIFFSYFNLSKNAYETLTSKPISFQVDEGGSDLNESTIIASKDKAAMILLDVSGSMLAEDIQPENRLKFAKDVVSELVRIYQDQNIGLKAFAREVVTISAVKKTKEDLLKNLDTIHVGMIADGTAMGDAIYEGVKELKKSTSQTKTIILLTDGANNSGHLDPLTSADYAKEDAVTIHIIALGRKGPVPFPVPDSNAEKRYVQTEIKMDEDVLREIARITGGSYSRVENKRELTKSLQQIKEEISPPK